MLQQFAAQYMDTDPLCAIAVVVATLLTET